MALTILSYPFVQEALLPFILIFTLIFAILQKTKALGDGKKQIDALVSFAIALIVISYGFATSIISSLLPFLAIASVSILVFMLLYGMAFKSGEFEVPKFAQIVIGVAAALGVIIMLLVSTGGFDKILDFLDINSDSQLWFNVIFVIVVVGALAFAFFGGGKGSEKKKD